MLLALLMLVVGRLGGPLGGPAALPLETDLLIGRGPGGAESPLGLSNDCDGLLVTDADTARCGGALLLVGPGVDMDSPDDAIAVRGGPALGGGGVADDISELPSLPAFLLTHLFNSGS
jgi:hypothetical protein